MLSTVVLGISFLYISKYKEYIENIKKFRKLKKKTTF